MAIILADGLFNGKRLRACSDNARLLWPYLFLASNGFGRLEIDYEFIIRNFFVDFRNPPKSSELFGIIREYYENGLLFLYESNGVWGQWDCKPGSLPRYQTSKDRKSPAPVESEFNEWKRRCALKSKTHPWISEIFGNFQLGIGVGVGEGNGVGDQPLSSHSSTTSTYIPPPPKYPPLYSPVEDVVVRFRQLHPKPSNLQQVTVFFAEQYMVMREDAERFTAWVQPIETALQRWAKHWSKNGAQFAPKLTEWLRDEGWTKDPPAPPKPYSPFDALED